ncbi:MAG: dephospho-CoA kinase [Gammaproteobacteria bacterium]|nr:dephospho-CoA kinase [Gammaproteobacteria bacterium]
MQHAKKPLRVGLTGGIASGKSTVADMFRVLGAAVIDTDVIAREVVTPGRPALAQIRRAFGESMIRKDGTLDRNAMRQLVFSDEAARRELEAILHPRIQAEARRQADEAGGEYQIIVIPLLVESSLKSFVDRILVVDCDTDTQIRRLLARDAESEKQARRILAAQTSRDERLAIADDVITNDGPLTDTKRQVAALHKRYAGLKGHDQDIYRPK